MVAHGGVNGGELLQTSHPPEAQHRLSRRLNGRCEFSARLFSQRSVTDPAVPAQAAAAVRQAAVDYLTRDEGWNWPAVVDNLATPFDWSLLYADPALQGEARLDAQYFRANIDPTELYVLSPPNAQQYRLASDQSGFDNLVLAGDWTDTGLPATIESAVMSGHRAAALAVARLAAGGARIEETRAAS